LAFAIGFFMIACCASMSATVGAERSRERPAPLPRVSEKDVAEVATEIDRLLSEELFGDATEVAEATDDVNFLRRVSLDLIGELPSPESITAFTLDSSPEKRSRATHGLLENRLFGQNWARYWRDVIMYRRNDERALLASTSLVVYLTKQFNQGAPWDKIARELITAKGNILQEGSTGLIAAQWGEVPDTAAEVSRILMGIQIQCAQCHDHPTDRWKREQFHSFAAFFPRIAVRPIRNTNGMRRGFELVSRERQRRRPGQGNARKKKKKPKDNTGPEHYMPDLKEPTARGTLMEPQFFVTGQTLETDISDEQRRERLARWITSRNDPWFAKAFINRIWAELVGEGFYEPVDDLGPDRECSAPGAMDLLAEQFVAHAYDVKWLYATIVQTKAYQRDSKVRRSYEGTPFVANCPQRLRSDQLFNALTTALDIPEPPASRRGRVRRGLQGPRAEIARIFGYDPSNPRDEVIGAIDQALMLMNSPNLDRGMRSTKKTVLGRLLREIDDDESIAMELYLRCLAREPEDAELETCLDYVHEVGDRNEAFEDILWALVNSTEFLYRD